MDPPTSERRTRSTILSKTTPLGVGDWLTDKDILCWLNQGVCHMEIDEPRVWTMVVQYIKRLSKCMQRVESGTRLANMRWCRCQIFLFNFNDKEGMHWFVCAFNCCVRLELWTILVWEPLTIKELLLTNQAPRLGIPNGPLVLWFSKLEHREAGGGAARFFSRCAPRPNRSRFCGLGAQHC